MFARRLIAASLSAAAVFFATVPSAPAQESPAGERPGITSLPEVPQTIHQALQEREYAAAARLINAALEKEDVADADYLLYLKGRAQTELKIYDEAIATFTALETRFPESRWLARSRFGRADISVRQRDYREAGRIYEAEAARLLSDGRKDQLAGIYLEFADRYYEGIPSDDPAAERQPDYKQALTYYRETLTLNPGLQLRQKTELRIARCLQETGQLPQAVAAYQSFLEQYAGEGIEEDRRGADELVVDARYQLGRAQLAAGNPEAARKTWQDFLNSEVGKRAGKELLPEAAFRLAGTYGIPNPSSEADLELGMAAHEAFLATYPDHELAPPAEYEIAGSYIALGRYEPAVEQLRQLIDNENYEGAEQVAEARYLLGETFFAQKKFREAIAAFRAFLDKHPTNKNWAAVQRRVIDSEFQTAEQQRHEKNYEQARKLWETFLNKYPLDGRAVGILYRFGQMQYAAGLDRLIEEAKQAGEQEKKEFDSRNISDEVKRLFNSAITDWRRLVSKYPQSKESSLAGYTIGTTLEDRLGQLAEALEAYRKVTGPYQPAAQQRIKNLTAKQLDILTERKFRSDEEPSIRIRTRNIEKVSVKLYRIDMADYFRKMHLASGVETLDIALIDPDQSWEYEVDGYEEYRQLLNDVEIPVEGPGVTAVTVSSEKLEATTMVVVSDLDIIVKSSRNELFVFAENMLTQEPAEGVSLLISDGNEIFAEEITNNDGILQKSYEQMKSVEDLRVFAIRVGHAASSVCNLNGLEFAVGLAPAGYLYTDRPAYRAGQLVNLKGIVRWVQNDTYVFKEGEEYKLDVYDARGRVVHTDEVALNRFGTFAANFTLPATAPQGDYRVHLHQPGREQSYETTFRVHEYRLEPVQLLVDLPKHVYYRGETIEGKIVLKYYYGTPLAGREIQYSLDDGPLQTAKTDEKGEVQFTFDTARYSESQPLSISASFSERSLESEATLYLATRGFDIEVETQREVYISGETFDVTVNVSDPAGEPVGTDLKLEVLETTRPLSDYNTGSGAGSGFFSVADRNPAGVSSDPRVNKRGERLIASYDLKTEEGSGRARRTIRIDEPGNYVLRVSGTDQFENRVSGSSAVQISGDEDKVRLRILADKHHHRVGESAQVQLHWRDEPALALVTYEGAEILGYRLVELKPGANALEIPLESKLAPNFVLAVAVMEGNRFHQAQSEFRVERQLNVEMKPSATTLKPGEELIVDLRVTDSHGNPVSAELSLGLVQKNLLEYFYGLALSDSAEISDLFGGGYRQPQMRAFTSATFSYRPQTRSISQYLLAEAERQKILEMELAAKRELAQRSGRTENLAADVAESVPGIRMGMDDAETEARSLERLVESMDGLPSLSFLPLAEERALGAYDYFSMRNSAEDVPQLGGLQRNMGSLGGGAGGAWGGGGFGRGIAAGEEAAGIRVQPRGQNRYFVEGFSIPGAEASRADFDSLKALAKQAADANGYGTAMTEYESTLSLVIQQTEHLNAADKRLLLELSRQPDAILGLNSIGELQVVNGLSEDRLEELAKQGLRILPGAGAAETGYWNPVVVTDAEGKAQVSFHLPDRSTAWVLEAVGSDARTLTGGAQAEIITRKDLFGEMKTPLAFTEGDKAQVLVEVHNAVVEKDEEISVTLKAKIGERTTEVSRTLTSAGGGLQEVAFPVELTGGDAVELVLTVSAGELADQSSTTIPIRPYGMPVFATRSGSSNQSTIVFVEHDKKLAVEGPELEILIGPGINRTLLEAVLGGGISICEPAHLLPPSGIERSISDAIGGMAMLKMIGGSRSADTPESEALAGRIRSALFALVSSQRKDGGWSWSGKPEGGQGDPLLSSRVVWALASARGAGFAVPQETFNKGVTFLKSAFSSTNRSAREEQAIILHGLAQANAADFALANRLYRERNSLSPAGLLHVALLLAKIDRKEMAGEVLQLVNIDVEKENGSDPALRRVIPWMKSGVELRALYLLALEEIDPGHKGWGADAPKVADWLMAHRYGSRWIPEKANGPAVAALAEWFSRTKRIDEKYTLAVYVNDRELKTLTVDPSRDGTRRLSVPEDLFVEGKPQRINFDLQGRGTFSYSVVLGGFVPAEKLESTTTSWRITRRYHQAQRMLDGEAIPRGFGVISGNVKRFWNYATQVPLGEVTEVELSLQRWRSARDPDAHRDYLVITDPLPAGTAVLTESISGHFERYEITPGAITFYVGEEPYAGTIRYTLAGYLPGDYRTVPAVARSFYQPERIAVSKPNPLAVLARGEKSGDEYKLTPDELYHFGRRLIAKGDDAAAYEHLSALFRTYPLQANIYREVVGWLFEATLALGKHREIVEFFEIIKERYPEVEIGFADIIRVARAYRELGEYERSYLVFRATVEASFQKESRIAGFLDGQGEFLRSVEVMEQLLRQYPAESYIATATYSLAGEVYGKGLEGAGDEKLRAAKVGKVELIAASIRMLDHFLTTWPEDPAADEAAFSMANAYLDLEQYETVIARCERFAERYPDSRLLDSFWYVIGYSRFALGNHEQALEMCRQVAETTRTDPETGIELAAVNKWQAIYIMGQVFHSLGKPSEAIAEYERVDERFPDASEAIDFFTRKAIKLPEVTTVKPGEAAKVPLEFRNIASAGVKVYRIDLLKFGLMQRNLNRITAINLAGIRPYHELSLELGDGKDYRDREQALDLPLEEEGAYLVVCRGETLYTSGLVLVSPLELQVQEDAASGRVRVTVRNVVADQYVRDVHVKVIGSENEQFTSGETDLRGIFVADAIRGTGTVIARAEENRYAFYRGKTRLGDVPKSAPAPSNEPAAEQTPAEGKPAQQQLLENLRRSNSGIQQQQRMQYRELLENKEEGVRAKKAF